MTRRILALLAERQISDETRLRRVVAVFQRELGAIFGNASVRRRNRQYEIQMAVYEKPIPDTGQSYRPAPRRISAWVKHAADRAHPRLYKRIHVDMEPWRVGHSSSKLFCPVRITVDARQ